MSTIYKALSWTLCFYRGDTHKTQYELCISMSVLSTYAHTLLSCEDTPTLRHVPLIPTLRKDLLKRMQWLLGIGVVEARNSGVFLLWRDFMKGNKLFLEVLPMLKTLIWLSTALGQPPQSQFKCHHIPAGLFHPSLSLFSSPPEWIPFRNPNAPWSPNCMALQTSSLGPDDLLLSLKLIPVILLSCLKRCTLFQEGFLALPSKKGALPLCPC